MAYLGLAPKKTDAPVVQDTLQKEHNGTETGTSDEAKRIAAAALAAVKNAAAISSSKGGKIEVCIISFIYFLTSALFIMFVR